MYVDCSNVRGAELEFEGNFELYSVSSRILADFEICYMILYFVYYVLMDPAPAPSPQITHKPLETNNQSY